MITNSSRFLGKWILDPTKNNYETPTAPKEGTYTIILVSPSDTSEGVNGETLEFQMEWVDHNGEKQQASYRAIVDGQRHAYENPAIAEWIVTTLHSDGVMETCTYKDDVVTSSGMRSLSLDGKTMDVTQSFVLPTGQKITNCSVYVAAQTQMP